jgi:hypothetical protein
MVAELDQIFAEIEGAGDQNQSKDTCRNLECSAAN